MTREEAIKVLERAEGYIGIHYINGVEDPYINPCLLKAIDFAVAALREQEERRWIPVTERLPSKSGCYVVIDGKYASVLNYSSRHQLFNAFDDLDPEYVERHAIMPTHWMPLPKPPKGE